MWTLCPHRCRNPPNCTTAQLHAFGARGATTKSCTLLGSGEISFLRSFSRGGLFRSPFTTKIIGYETLRQTRVLFHYSTGSGTDQHVSLDCNHQPLGEHFTIHINDAEFGHESAGLGFMLFRAETKARSRPGRNEARVWLRSNVSPIIALVAARISGFCRGFI